jgi:hypothetical protein
VGFFSNRRKRESAIPESSSDPALGSFASSEGQPVVGRQVGGGQPGGVQLEGLGAMDGLALLTQLGPMIQQAMAQGNVHVEQGAAQTIDARGTELGDEIREIMSQHGIEPGGAVASGVDANSLAGMQQQILQALAKHGIDSNAAGSSIQFPSADEGT